MFNFTLYAYVARNLAYLYNPGIVQCILGILIMLNNLDIAQSQNCTITFWDLESVQGYCTIPGCVHAVNVLQCACIQ